jgi:hypothetical protein
MEKSKLSNLEDPMTPLRLPTLRFVLLQLRALKGFALDRASFRSLYHGAGSLRGFFLVVDIRTFLLGLDNSEKSIRV